MYDQRAFAFDEEGIEYFVAWESREMICNANMIICLVYDATKPSITLKVKLAIWCTLVSH